MTPEGEARRLIAEGLHLCMYGERAPGGDETWAEWGRKAEDWLRRDLDERLPVTDKDGYRLGVPVSAEDEARLSSNLDNIKRAERRAAIDTWHQRWGR